MKYIVLAPPFRDKSYGNRVMYQLADLLLQNGEEVCIFGIKRHTVYSDRMKELGLSFLEGEPEADDIVIYPEVVTEQYFKKPHRAVRYILHRTGHHNGRLIPYGPHDLIITYSVALDPDLFELPILLDDRSLFFPTPQNTKKDQAVVYLGKGSENIDRPEIQEFLSQFESIYEITRDIPANRQELAKVLQESKVLVSIDCLTGMIQEATLCGTPVYVPDDYFGVADVGFAGLPYSGVFSDPSEFASASKQVHLAIPEFDEELNNNIKTVKKFIDFSKAYFEQVEGSDNNNDALLKYISSINPSRIELDQFRWEDFQQNFLDEKHKEFHRKMKHDRESIPNVLHDALRDENEMLTLQNKFLNEHNQKLRERNQSLKEQASSQKTEGKQLKETNKNLEKFKSRALDSWRMEGAPPLLRGLLKIGRLLNKIIPPYRSTKSS